MSKDIERHGISTENFMILELLFNKGPYPIQKISDVAEVPCLFKPEQVLYVGLNDMMEPLNSNPMKNMKLDIVGPDEIKQDSSKVLQWLAARKPSKIIIHFDLDVLDMKEFRSLLVAYPGT
ncbi:hypothetical protein [Paenibacillus sp. Soil522]|uniref:hypothetical protein n=1 Tax=Paenibacillus sp. Soil522 TaxID=1736388 RepID=UPI001910A4E1|nr:hypothetical protein [Paenibacillus sp. Soil522]